MDNWAVPLSKRRRPEVDWELRYATSSVVEPMVLAVVRTRTDCCWVLRGKVLHIRSARGH